MRSRVAAMVAGAVATWAMGAGLASGEPVAGATDLALRSVSVNADNGMLRWTVQTAGVLNPSDVSPDPGAGPCLTWWTGASAAARVRLCLDGRSGRLLVERQNLASDGSVTAARTLDGSVSRVGERGASASVSLRALGLGNAILYWQASSPGACGAACETHVPAVGKGTLDLRTAPRTLPALLAPPSHPDSHDAGASPLDLREVTFGQQGTRLVLTVRTRQAWKARSLAAKRSLCLLIGRTSALAHPARLCVEAHAGGAQLRLRSRRASATVSEAGTLRAGVLPSALGLGLGPHWWAIESRWTDDAACAPGCEDRAPDSGAFPVAIAALGTPPCFGAAARAPRHPCGNPALRAVAYPRPESAVVWPNAACRPLRPRGAVFDPCAFGFTGAGRRGTVALVGDSHAEHWRAALEVVAQVKRWRGISITRPGCPFSVQIPSSPTLGPAACAAQHAETITWLRAHPDVRTLFVSDWAEPPSGPQGGIGGYGGGAASFGAMLDRLPASVRHVYVLRDIPATTLSSTTCVQRRLGAHRAIGSACASPRAAVLTPDPGASAALARRPRARVIDLTRLFCGATRCYPVIGGVYVHKDDNHMNAVLAATLGPFVLRALAATS